VNGYSSETAITSVPPLLGEDEQLKQPVASAECAAGDGDGSAEHEDDDTVKETAIMSVPPPLDELEQPVVSTECAAGDGDGSSAEHQDDNDTVTDTKPTTTD